MGNRTAKHRYLRLAIDSAKRARSLSPKSIEFAHLYANLLYEAAQEGREYEEVVGECERALEIENPIDLARERVEGELRSLIQKARRKEIEIRVAAARLLQHKEETEGKRKTAEELSNGGTKPSGQWRMDEVRCYWNSVSHVRKKSDFLGVSVSDMKAHFKEEDGSLGYEVLCEGLLYGESKRTWKVCMCCECGESFVDRKSLVKHVIENHLEKASVDSMWAFRTVGTAWGPLYFPEQVPYYGPQVRFDKCSSSESKSESKSREIDNYVKLDCTTCNPGDQDVVNTLRWPFSDDRESSKLLEIVRYLFQFLIRQKCLSYDLFSSVLQLFIDKLKTLAPGSPILNCGLDHMCFAFIRSGLLRETIMLLHQISNACVVGRYPDEIGPRDPSIPHHPLDQLVLSDDASFLLLDKSLLPDSLLSWIFDGPSAEEQLALWSRTREARNKQAMELHLLLEKKFVHLQDTFESKIICARHVETLRELEQLCIEDRNRGSSYGSVLIKRMHQIHTRTVDINTCNWYFDGVTLMQDILEKALCVQASHMCDISGGEGGESKDRIEIAMQRELERLSLELSEIDESIKQSISSIQKLEDNLESVNSELDYSSVLLPLVKSFLRAKLKERNHNPVENGEPAMWMDYCFSSYDAKCASVDSEELEREAELEAEKRKLEEAKQKHLAVCKEALTALQCGSHVKALHLIKEAALQHDPAPLLHRCHAAICVKVAEIKDDPTEKRQYVREGIDSARKAWSLSPNSIEFAHFYANLLYEDAIHAQEGSDLLGEVLSECERALAIEDPIDPAEECFEEEQQMLPTAEGRIYSVKRQLALIFAHLVCNSEEDKNMKYRRGGNDEWDYMQDEHIDLEDLW